MKCQADIVFPISVWIWPKGVIGPGSPAKLFSNDKKDLATYKVQAQRQDK